MREDGCGLDAFALQLVGLPAPEGDGPTESERFTPDAKIPRWTAPIPGDFRDAGNWTPSTLPSTDLDGIMELDGTSVAILGEAHDGRDLYVRTFADDPARALRLDLGAVYHGRDLWVGTRHGPTNGGDDPIHGFVELDAGKMNLAGDLAIGALVAFPATAVPTTGRLTLRQGSALVVGGDLAIGVEGGLFAPADGTLEQLGGSVVVLGDADLAVASATGRYAQHGGTTLILGELDLSVDEDSPGNPLGSAIYEMSGGELTVDRLRAGVGFGVMASSACTAAPRSSTTASELGFGAIDGIAEGAARASRRAPHLGSDLDRT